MALNTTYAYDCQIYTTISVLSPDSPRSYIQTTSSISPLGCQLYILNIYGQSRTPNFPLKPSVFINWLPSNPHTVSLDGIFILSVAQGKNVCIRPSLLFPMTHVQYTLGNPGGSIFKIKFRAQAAFHQFHCGSFGPSTDIANLYYSSRFLTGLSVPPPPLPPHRLFTPERAEWSF